MDTTFAVALGLLAAIFLGSFVILVLLCRYKTLRKRTAVYVKRLARNELSRSDIELIDSDKDKRSKRRRTSYGHWDDDDERRESKFDDQLYVKCTNLLKICSDIDLKQMGPQDLMKIRNIVQIARSISEETNTNDSEKFRLIEDRTAVMLANVSQALLKMDKQLMNLKETSLEHMEFLSNNCII